MKNALKKANVEKRIRAILKDAEEVDWGYDSEAKDEFAEVTFNSAKATEDLLKLMEELGIEFAGK